MRSLFAFWIGGASSPVPSGGRRSMLAFWMGGASSGEIEEHHGGGWGKDLYTGHPRKKKTLAKYKKEYYDLTEFEIKEEVAEIEANVKQARKEIEFNQDLGLSDVISKIKVYIEIEKIKLAALEQIEQEKYKRKKLDTDLAFIAAYLMIEDDDE